MIFLLRKNTYRDKVQPIRAKEWQSAEQRYWLNKVLEGIASGICTQTSEQLVTLGFNVVEK